MVLQVLTLGTALDAAGWWLQPGNGAVGSGGKLAICCKAVVVGVTRRMGWSWQPPGGVQLHGWLYGKVRRIWGHVPASAETGLCCDETIEIMPEKQRAESTALKVERWD